MKIAVTGFLPEQLKDNPRPGAYSMEPDDMVTAVQTALEVLGGLGRTDGQ